jgi:D-xylose transport system substrate-binding protein
VDRGDVKIVADQYAKEWKASEALNITENALTQTRNDIVAVIASNDGTAGGAIQAVEEQKLTGKVIVTGQDAELAACQRIVEGKQSMTIYKPIKPLADSAVESALKLARGEKVQATDKVNNGMKDVPAILQEPIAVDKSNMADTVIKEGFQKLEAVYQNVPKDQWPKAATARVGREDAGAASEVSGLRRTASVGLALSALLLAFVSVRRRKA